MPTVDFRLYLVTDRRQTGGRPLIPLLLDAMSAGVSAIQLRERDLGTRSLLGLAEQLFEPTRQFHAKLFLNDRVDLVTALSLPGVHLRANSLSGVVARRLIGPECLVGVSAHSVEDVIRGESEGANFVVLGPIYDTPSKRAYGAPLGLSMLEEACRRVRIPVFAIGGVTTSRVREVRHAGAFGVAVVSSLLNAANVERAARDLVEAATGSL